MQLGDDYAAEANIAAKMGYIKPAERERLIAAYDDRAADCYSKVVTRYPMAPHVEDAREKLIALGRPVPEPTQAELAESRVGGAKPRQHQAEGPRHIAGKAWPLHAGSRTCRRAFDDARNYRDGA